MKVIFPAITSFISSVSFAQKQTSDTASFTKVHGTILELLSILSENGKSTDWDAFRNLFLPYADLNEAIHDKTWKRPLFC